LLRPEYNEIKNENNYTKHHEGAKPTPTALPLRRHGPKTIDIQSTSL